ncbi:dihydrolipoyllysine-residue succinyltransferase component of 2-oxoglutarate dehydrogenase complex [Caedimonas varicaedens]|jgi:2-oxoglutarate dehydrogenase E2 component (dihydrolipoamide succinyltransferase)|uniref:Dihydrolipoyllysine-residue succinyltransferase component of 2-oxoglutarate dehydrogenase complex n=1 Tax=Caedimonas varicaedens TaxID=1629334 RepID=A0A0K8ME90_9PROT|nr:dihydrolipoyllysine-residue succinyltransferase component of 2-oxoglutarate dehydrogenase complex [Caedimonas varicaedens]
MTNELIVPSLGESVSEATVSKWLKKVGESIKMDDPLVELETDKVTLEVNAPVNGILENIVAPEGTVVFVGKVLGSIGDSGSSEVQQSQPAPQPAFQPSMASFSSSTSPSSGQAEPILSPAARKMAEEGHIQPQDLQGTAPGGRVTKNDISQFETNRAASAAPTTSQSSAPSDTAYAMTSASSRQVQQIAQPEERVRMTRLRQRIAERLKEAQNTAAMLTTFNEIDMSHVMATRDSYREKFEKRFGIKLGFMSFFVKAVVSALKEIPAVNAEIDGEYIIYKNYYDIGVAVAAPQGLVVPVVRDADHLNFAEIEMTIAQLGEKARTGKLSMEDLNGGTFTITNGGVFGSLMSTPILNPPQSGILGMHKIQKRPVVVDDRIDIRPMMYVALTYDHRVIDGREAVTFLVRVKENIEDPQRILLGV